MKLLGPLVPLLLATSAIASMRPGSPPWSCFPTEVCNPEHGCASLLALPLGFFISSVEREKSKFTIKGHNGIERNAMLFPRFDDAQDFIGTDQSEPGVSVILIPNDRVWDAHGFWAHSVYERGNGQRFIGKDKTLFSCNSNLKG